MNNSFHLAGWSNFVTVYEVYSVYGTCLAYKLLTLWPVAYTGKLIIFYEYFLQLGYEFVNLCIKGGKAVFCICPKAVTATMYRNIWAYGV
jgi:hypothetical protein